MIAAASQDSGTTAAAVAFIIVGAIMYFIPTIVALSRRGEVNTGGIVALNFFLGWTVAGWVIALVMACRTQVRQQVYYAPPPGWAPPAGPPPPPSPQGPPSDMSGYR